MLPLPAGKEASSGAGTLEYERHRPERTLLYQLVEDYYPALKAHIWSAPHCKGKIAVYMKDKLQSYIRHLDEGLSALVP